MYLGKNGAKMAIFSFLANLSPFDCGYPRERDGDKLVDNSLYTRKKIKNSPKNGQLTNISVWT